MQDHLNKPRDLLLRSSPPAVIVNQDGEEIKNTIGSPTRPSALPFPSSPLEENPSQEDEDLMDQLLQEPTPTRPFTSRESFTKWKRRMLMTMKIYVTAVEA